MCRIMEEILNEGLEKGREQGLAEGKLEERLQLAESLLRENICSKEKVIELTGLSDEDIRSILDRISDKQE